MRKSRFMDQQMAAILREPARAPTSVGGTKPPSSRFRDDSGNRRADCGRVNRTIRGSQHSVLSDVINYIRLSDASHRRSCTGRQACACFVARCSVRDQGIDQVTPLRTS